MKVTMVMKEFKGLTLDNNDELRIAGIVRESIVDGPGIRFVIFCQGCPHNCRGCHNPETHDFKSGYNCSIDKIVKAIDENPMLQGITFSGGEPLCQSAGFLSLAKEVKARNLNLLIYTGYTFEALSEMRKSNASLDELLNLTDILVDGPFEEEQKDLTLQYRGSRNQRVIDMKLSNEVNAPVLIDGDVSL